MEPWAWSLINYYASTRLPEVNPAIELVYKVYKSVIYEMIHTFCGPRRLEFYHP